MFMYQVYNALFIHSPMEKAEKMSEKSKRSKLLGEDTINLKFSELLSSSSVIVWTSTHTIRGRIYLYRLTVDDHEGVLIHTKSFVKIR